MIRLRLIPLKFPKEMLGRAGTSPRQRWRVEFAETGEVLLRSARDPEYDAARALQERGVTGSFETIHQHGGPGMRFPSIEEAAKWQVSDPDDGLRPPHLIRWKPFPTHLKGARTDSHDMEDAFF